MLSSDREIADLQNRLSGMRTVMFAMAVAISDDMPETKPRVVALLRAFLKGAAKGHAASGEVREMQESLDLLEAIRRSIGVQSNQAVAMSNRSPVHTCHADMTVSGVPWSMRVTIMNSA